MRHEQLLVIPPNTHHIEHHGSTKEDAQIRPSQASHRPTRCPPQEKRSQRRRQAQKARRRRSTRHVRILHLLPLSTAYFVLTRATQSASTFLHVLPTQHRPPTPLLRPRRHKLPLPHRPQQTRTLAFTHGLPLRHLPPHNNILRNGRAGKTRPKIPHCLKNCQR